MNIKNRNPLSWINDLFDHFKGATIFTNIDLRLGYHQVCIKEKNIYKTTFCTSYGHYDFVVVHFGLTNPSATFMCLMNNVLFSYLDKFVIFFVDDILVYLKNE